MGSSAAGEAALQKIYDLLARIDAKTRELQQGVDNALQNLPSIVADKVVEVWNKFTAELGKLWSKISEWLSRIGSPSALSDAADAWVRTVGGPVSGHATAADLGRLKTDNEWSGDAADAYKDMMPLQKDMLVAVKGYADAIATVLNYVATGIVVFIVAIGVALTAMVVGILAAIAGVASVIGTPAAIAGVVAAVVACAVSIGGGAWELSRRTREANTDLLKVRHDGSKLVGGHWPPTVTA